LELATAQTSEIFPATRSVSMSALLAGAAMSGLPDTSVKEGYIHPEQIKMMVMPNNKSLLLFMSNALKDGKRPRAVFTIFHRTGIREIAALSHQLKTD
jgi:hypothetical protein